MKKFICPFCKEDLRKVGIENLQSGVMVWNCEIINDKGEIGEWGDEEFEGKDGGDYYCGNCQNELDLEKLGLFI